MTKADCKLCENRGRINGLSEETFCFSCVHGEPWKKDYYKPISTIPEKMRSIDSFLDEMGAD